MATNLHQQYAQLGLWSEERIGWMLSSAARRWPDREAINFEGQRYTYGQLWRWVTAQAHDFAQRGIGHDSKVLIHLGNCMEVIVTQLACWRVGAVSVPVIPIYRAHELAHIIADSKPDVVISAGAAGSRQPHMEIEKLLGELKADPMRIVVGEGAIPSWRTIAPAPAPEVTLTEAGLPDPAPSDRCILVLYTSGTTSAPKGVMLTSRALLCNLESWYRTAGLSQQDVFFSGSPLAHIAALASALLMPMRIGARTVLMSGWDPDKAVRLIEAEKATFMSGASIFVHDLVKRYSEGASPTHRLRNFYSGGAPTPPELVEQADALGVKVIRCYGMTETAGTTTYAQRDAPLAKRAYYDGQVEFGTEMQAVDDNRDPLPPGESGHIRIRSPKMMIGYTDAKITADQLDCDGWFYPGDIGIVEADGWFRMTGRTKDIINRGGEKFSAVDIERALMSHPIVDRAAVIGVPDQRLGEVVAAFITLKKDQAWTGPESVIAHLEGVGLARAKFPVQWRVIQDLPTSATGKVVKAKLMELVELESVEF